MRSQEGAQIRHGDDALNAELTNLRSCVLQYVCWLRVLGGAVSTKARSPGDTSLLNPVEVANWTKFTGMVPPVIGSTYHFGSWQYDVIADNSG